MKTKKAHFYLILGALVAFAWLSIGLCIRQWPDQKAHLVFCDVGQGDATLLIQGFTQVLVDGGKDTQVLTCLEKHLPWWDRTIEVVVATHVDADHIGGLPEVFGKYHVQHFLTTNQVKNTAEFLSLAQAVKLEREKGLRVVQATAGQRLILGSILRATVIWPFQSAADQAEGSIFETERELWDMNLIKEEKAEDTNAGSIALNVQLGPAAVLLMADIEEVGELALITEGLTDNIDILKVGHHGSKNATSDTFLRATQPEFAIISAGQNNQYGHPNPEVLLRLEEAGVKTWRTDQVGDIEVISTRENFWFSF